MYDRYGIASVPGAMQHLFRVSNALPIAALLLAACTAQTNSGDEAYWNGCRAGRADTGGTISTYAANDDPRYSTDASYRQAWDGGYATCFNQKFLRGGGGGGGR
jgi:hypothetical protein